MSNVKPVPKSYVNPVETVYNGYRFRSRLEARWAVFFDAGYIRYEYEPEGYETAVGRYLPDFYLPDFDTHVEVKGMRDGYEREIIRLRDFIIWGGPIRRILILSDVPDKTYDGGLWHFPCYYYDGRKDSTNSGWWFFFDYDERVAGNISHANYILPSIDEWDFKRGRFSIAPQSDYSPQMARSKGAMQDKERQREYWPAANYHRNKLTFAALKAARQARFEHGETPRTRKESVQGR